MGVEAMIESTDDKVCCVGVEDDEEDEFAAPNSASVLYSEVSLSGGLAVDIWKKRVPGKPQY